MRQSVVMQGVESNKVMWVRGSGADNQGMPIRQLRERDCQLLQGPIAVENQIIQDWPSREVTAIEGRLVPETRPSERPVTSL